MKTFDKSNTEPGWQPTRDELSEWLRKQALCTFSSLDQNGAPESATVAFSETSNGEFIVGTSETFHKSQNVDRDERVALVVTNYDDRYTAQIKGTARKLSETAFGALADEHYRQRPESLPFKDEPGQTHILVQPQNIRFSDCSVQPWLVTEYSSEVAI